ncbi:MerR family transcriptional regulator [Simiduia agarivorans]|uniref:MerR family transcriptional regulator n=1 Tax=Simiduia agarivorans (strain DSM 21679 / JCM 13881 / BCRC 17597 / SA1) TaxID=1117647 RepID=K4KVB4_SIMAS|nr:MerR family transcriptional regulator [Simiduia agarivorans]AFU97892.1 MerR family transcriptional regulator [Simiduia agarivorans SA1 = DSM 21679]
MVYIHQAAERTGLSPKAIRYYEQLALVVPEKCPDNGYRLYSRENLSHLCFLQHARGVGFSVKEAGELLALYRSTQSHSAKVKALVADKLQILAAKRAELERLESVLSDLWASCDGDDCHRCAILERLAGEEFHHV